MNTIQRNVIAGNRTVGDRTFRFRSGFEWRWGYYLQILKNAGEIKDWDYEPRKFKFYGKDISGSGLKGKEIGVRVYTPDFKVYERNGGITWQETKGFLDSKSYTKVKCFRQYYPTERIELIMQRLPSYRGSARSRNILVKLKRLEDMGVTVRDGSAIDKQMKGIMK